MLNRGDVVRQIGVGRHEHCDQGQRKHQDCKPRRQQCGGAGGRPEPQPANQHQECPHELQRVATTPEQDFVVSLAHQRMRQHEVRPDKRQQRDGGGHCRRTDAKTQCRMAVDQRPRGRRCQQGPQHQQAGTRRYCDQPGKEDSVVQHRDVIRHYRLRVTGKGGGGHGHRAQASQHHGYPAQREKGAAPADAPHQTGDRNEPHQH